MVSAFKNIHVVQRNRNRESINKPTHIELIYNRRVKNIQ